MHEFLRGQVAQSVEQGTENPRVGGSIPSLTTYLFFLSFSLSLFPLTAMNILNFS